MAVRHLSLLLLVLLGCPVSTPLTDGGAEVPPPDAGTVARSCRAARLELGSLVGDAGPVGARALTSRDVSRDGRPDLVLLLKDVERLVVLEQQADAGFHAVAVLEAGSTPNDLEAVDLDGDGRDELLVVGHFSDALRVSRGVPGGWAPPTIYPLGNHSQRLALLDLDADGRLDVVTQNGGSAGVFTFTFLLGRGDGTFAPAVASSVPDTPADLAVRARGPDGRPEALIATANTARIERWSFTGDGGFVSRPPFELPARPLRLSVPDGDGPWLATHGFESPGFVSVLEPEDGGLRVKQRLPVDDAFEALLSDVTDDGRADVVATTLSGEVLVFEAQPAGDFGLARHLSDGDWPTSLIARDLDQDGRVDLAWTSADGLLEFRFDADRCGR